MSRIVAIGSRAFVLAMAGVGAEPMQAETIEAFDEAVRKVALRRNVDLVFVPEPQLKAVPDALKAFSARSAAALLALPLTPGSEHPSLMEVRRLVEQATGASLI